ncbi:GNAT family N-acetyltransferase [Idiomarina xiamenensis]|uniref:Acetyltransferase n=1 Tax=Idiomarina xiamenensis 10-D-4 TaxID=740709 RepID=K2L3E4_9GAMM|nr:GNAT family N-acetyltransferase [Idiomarina xiamenensis]EKE84395.1 acetyltransferase [Idiomarina xiamenensis 10-D-4]
MASPISSQSTSAMAASGSVLKRRHTGATITPDHLCRWLCELPLADVNATRRLPIMQALRRVLSGDNRQLSTATIANLVRLAQYLCDWPLLKRLTSLPQWDWQLPLWLQADVQMGDFEQAQARLDDAAEQHPQAPLLSLLQQEFAQYRSQSRYPPALMRHGAISLTPLAAHHVNDFAWQFADKSIAELCNLPSFSNPQQWLQWLYRCQQEPERHQFAIMHSAFGMIGSVCLQVFDELGFFYYWLGKDFQAQGFGPQAVNLLITLGQRQLGMQRCYAKVYAHNLNSQKALKKLQFEYLPLRAEAPNAQERFYHRGPHQTRIRHFVDLEQLLQRLNSGIELSPKIVV